jgi:hypothetical protein
MFSQLVPQHQSVLVVGPLRLLREQAMNDCAALEIPAARFSDLRLTSTPREQGFKVVFLSCEEIPKDKRLLLRNATKWHDAFGLLVFDEPQLFRTWIESNFRPDLGRSGLLRRLFRNEFPIVTLCGTPTGPLREDLPKMFDMRRSALRPELPPRVVQTCLLPRNVSIAVLRLQTDGLLGALNRVFARLPGYDLSRIQSSADFPGTLVLVSDRNTAVWLALTHPLCIQLRKRFGSEIATAVHGINTDEYLKNLAVGLRKVGAGQIKLLFGTLLITTGLHAPGVDNVIALGMSSLGSSAQLEFGMQFTQRAGRGDKPGTALLCLPPNADNLKSVKADKPALEFLTALRAISPDHTPCIDALVAKAFGDTCGVHAACRCVYHSPELLPLFADCIWPSAAASAVLKQQLSSRSAPAPPPPPPTPPPAPAAPEAAQVPDSCGVDDLADLAAAAQQEQDDAAVEELKSLFEEAPQDIVEEPEVSAASVLQARQEKKERLLKEAREAKLQLKRGQAAAAASVHSPSSTRATRASTRAGSGLSIAEEEFLEAAVNKRLDIEEKEVRKAAKRAARAETVLKLLLRKRLLEERTHSAAARGLSALSSMIQRQEQPVIELASLAPTAVSREHRQQVAEEARLRANPHLSYDLAELNKQMDELRPRLVALGKGKCVTPEFFVTPLHVTWLLKYPPPIADLLADAPDSLLATHLRCETRPKAQLLWLECILVPNVLREIREAFVRARRVDSCSDAVPMSL